MASLCEDTLSEIISSNSPWFLKLYMWFKAAYIVPSSVRVSYPILLGLFTEVFPPYRTACGLGDLMIPTVLEYCRATYWIDFSEFGGRARSASIFVSLFQLSLFLHVCVQPTSSTSLWYLYLLLRYQVQEKCVSTRHEPDQHGCFLAALSTWST